MGGAVDWGALDLMVELLGVNEVERFIHALVQIRDESGSDHDKPD
jgi:hypothetical protein